MDYESQVDLLFEVSMRTLCCLFAFLVATAVQAQDMPLSQIIVPGEDWKKIEGEFKPIRYLTSYDGKTVQVWDAQYKLQGSVDYRTGKLVKQTFEGALQSDEFSIDGDRTLIIDRVASTARIARNIKQKQAVNRLKMPIVEVGAAWVTADKGMLLVGDAADKYVWTYRIGPDGLSAGEKYMTLRVAKGETRSEVSDIRVDAAGRFFVATKEGVQIFDPTGRLCGVLSKPSKQRPTSIAFGGPELDILFMACGTEIYYRVMQAKRVAPVEKKGPEI